MKTLDITLDFETCALVPTAAVMSIGAVAWDRNGEKTPFIPDRYDEDDEFAEYSLHVDLRGMFVDGFTFDQDTANWWSKQNDNAKQAVLSDDDPEKPCTDIKDLVTDFFSWIDTVKETYGCDDVYLWSQGSDFDIAILRNICHKYGLEIPVKYTNFRDHRTFYLEGARIICERAGSEFDPKTAYKMVEQYDGKGAPHDPIFDCKRSIYSTWQMMKHLSCLNIEK